MPEDKEKTEIIVEAGERNGENPAIPDNDVNITTANPKVVIQDYEQDDETKQLLKLLDAAAEL